LGSTKLTASVIHSLICIALLLSLGTENAKPMQGACHGCGEAAAPPQVLIAIGTNVELPYARAGLERFPGARC
jgi:hypothetical protein